MLSKLIHSQSYYLFIPAHVVNQVGQGVSGGVSRETDDAAEHPVQIQLAVAEHMLHTPFFVQRASVSL